MNDIQHVALKLSVTYFRFQFILGGGGLTLNNKNDYEWIKAEISGFVAVSAFTNAIFGQKTGIMKIWNLNIYNNVFFVHLIIYWNCLLGYKFSIDAF